MTATDLLKERYKHSFKDRRRILREGSVRAQIYSVKYEAIADALYDFGADKNGIFLDAGCGDGVFISCVYQSFKQAVGLDLSFKSLLRTQQYIGLGRVIQGDVEAMPFKSGILSTVVLLETFEHLTNPDSALDEIVRCLKPKGLLIVTVPSIANPRTGRIIGGSSYLRGLVRVIKALPMGCKSYEWIDGDGQRYPHCAYSEYKMRRMIECAGLETPFVRRTALAVTAKGIIFEKVLNWLSRNFFGELLVAATVKEAQ